MITQPLFLGNKTTFYKYRSIPTRQEESKGGGMEKYKLQKAAAEKFHSAYYIPT